MNVGSPHWKHCLVVLLFLTCCTGNSAYQAKDPARALVEQLVDARLTTTEWDTVLHNILPELTRGTFDGRWQVNQRPKNGYLNLYVIRVRGTSTNLPDQVESVIGRCAYIGEPNVVVCDVRFIDWFLAKEQLVPLGRTPQETAEWQQLEGRLLLLWILSHELGHIQRRDGPAHNAGNAFVDEVTAEAMSQQQELTADAYSAQLLSAKPAIRYSTMGLLSSIINTEIRKKMGHDPPAGVGLLFNYTNRELIEYSTAGTHPEYIVRCVRVLQQMPTDSAFHYVLHQMASRMSAKQAQ